MTVVTAPSAAARVDGVRTVGAVARLEPAASAASASSAAFRAARRRPAGLLRTLGHPRRRRRRPLPAPSSSRPTPASSGVAATAPARRTAASRAAVLADGRPTLQDLQSSTAKHRKVKRHPRVPRLITRATGGVISRAREEGAPEIERSSDPSSLDGP